MNQLTGKIISIESSTAMSIFDVDIDGDILSAVVLETQQSAAYLKIGERVTLAFKETEVAIAKDLAGMISLRNRVKATIKNIQEEKVLTKITLQSKSAKIVSIISTRSSRRMNLKIGDRVEWLVKTNEMSVIKGPAND